MPVPKRKTSKSRRNLRRSHHARAIPSQVMDCPQCGEPSAMHRICAHCGFYKGKEVLQIPIE